ncbi:hypothetical protein H0H92_006818 [Tricholoma furcatifolium]|nr:hypothetical protein H0H92_006818 [Tricholoma furcatifolium]
MDTDKQRELIEQILVPDPSNANSLLNALSLSGLPTQDQVYRDIEEKLLLPRETLPKHWLPPYQIHWGRELAVPSLLTFNPSPPPTALTFIRAGLNGKVTGYVETANPRISTGLTSTSFDRAPAPSKTFVRGKSGYVPFWPGGLEDPLVTSPVDGRGAKGLRTIAPGLSRGLRLPGDEVEDKDLIALDDLEEPKLQNDLHAEDMNIEVERGELPPNGVNEIDQLLPTSTTHLKPVKPQRRLKRAAIQKRDWAHVIDVNTPFPNFHELVPQMAHKYPFELDTFQKQAVYHLEMGDSVFVAAHTSAGKTVVAEYAIALAEKHMTRAIYTSPIKALSNQKFRDFKQTFSSSSVGILTGDVQINPEAACLVMTTEILRSMLYKGADLIRDVEFVIFDEVHYVNDAERGVVWEEVIIMLPDHVNIILLSATVPNTKEFADWVGRTKKKDIYVISTAQRPVPLEHFLYAGRELYKIVDAKRNFIGQGYKDAGEALRRKQDKEREAAGLPPVQRVGARGAAPAQRGGQRGATPARGGRGVTPAVRGRGGGGGGGAPRSNFSSVDKNLYVHLLGHLRKKALLPVVVFTLSKKRCEENAATLTNLDLCSSVEKSEVHVAIEKALSRLKGSDKKLPQIARMRDLLGRGIGVHHGGLLPLVKEGVNMPAKCVVFSGIRKHDGRNFRDILPGEYTQMAGRAGRRGLDPTGTVIIVANDSLPEQTALHTMMLGTPGKLSSQFRLTYNMILNLLRVEALKVEEMIKRSFSENASQRLLPEQQKKVVEAGISEKVLSTLPKLECDTCSHDIHGFYDDSFDIVVLNQKLLNMAIAHPQGAKSMVGGRVVILRDGHFRTFTAAILLKPAPLQTSDSGVLNKVKSYYVLALVDPRTKTGEHDIDDQAVVPYWPPKPESLAVDDPVYELRAVPLTSVALVTNKSVKVEVDSIVERHLISRMKEGIAILQVLVEEWKAFGQIPENEWERMRALDFQELLQTRHSISQKLSTRSCTSCYHFIDHYAVIHGEKVLRANIANLKLAISDQNLELIPDYEQRVAVLQELKFIDENSTVLLKGRVACEINSANELVLTELILENTLASYEPEEVVALLSCFVFQEKTDVEPAIPPKLEEGRDAILSISDRVGRIQDYHKVSVEDFRSNLKFGLVEVVYEWAKGMPFEQITALTDVAEGTIVRVITRLDETCREVRDAARVIGDAELFKKMEEAQIKIKRDIMAKPLDDSDTPYTPIVFSEPISFPGRSRSAGKKRVANSGSDDGFDDDSHKTRRVNPHRLAARLGPDIVADMEALIYPGAKMPSFEVRKVIQERYSVDRRHIYDYFHSRGLRVAKEDRHTNLTRGRLAKLERQAALDKAETPVDNGNGNVCIDKRDEASEGKRQSIDPPNQESTHAQSSPASRTSPEISQQTFNTPDQLASRNAKLMAYERIASGHQKPSTPPQKIEIASKDRLPLKKGKKRKRRATIAQPLPECTSARKSSPCPVFTPLENVLDTSVGELDFTLPEPEFTLDLGDAADLANLNNYQSNSPVILEDRRPLTQTERQELYNFINDNIGPSYGTIERVGTYRAYMNERTVHYFNRVPLGATYTTRAYHAAYDPGLTPGFMVQDEEVDFRKWLSGCDEQSASDLESRVGLDQPSKETISYDNGRISGHFPSPSSIEDVVMQRAGDSITNSSINNILDHLHFDYSDNLRRSQTVFSETPTKHSTQVRATPCNHPRTHKNSVGSLQISLSDAFSQSPSHQNINRRFLHISNPVRTRTTSAGGGI